MKITDIPQTRRGYERFMQSVADHFADLIEQKKAPWDNGKPPLFPIDPVYHRPLSGITALQILCKEADGKFDDPRWLPQSQIRRLGGLVKEGETELVSVGYNDLTRSYLPVAYYNVDQCWDFVNLSKLEPERKNTDLFRLNLLRFFDLEVRPVSDKTQRSHVSDSVLYVSHGDLFDEKTRQLNPDMTFDQVVEADHIRAIMENLFPDIIEVQPKSPKVQTISNTFELSKRIGIAFLESRLGCKLPFVKPLSDEVRHDIAETIRRDPNTLIQATSRASGIVEEIFEIGENGRYLVVDFETENVLGMTGNECKNYIEHSVLNNLRGKGSFIQNEQYTNLLKSLESRGGFYPLRDCDFLNPRRDSIEEFGHKGLVFIPDCYDIKYYKNDLACTTVGEALAALKLCEAKNPKLAKSFEEVLFDSRIGPRNQSDSERHQWLNQIKEKGSLNWPFELRIPDVLQRWNDIDRQRQSSTRTKTLDFCYLVDFENQTVIKCPPEEAVDKSIALLSRFDYRKAEGSPNIAASLTFKVSDLCEREKTFDRAKASWTYKAEDKNELRSDINTCFEALSPTCGHNRTGNHILQSIDHKGMIIVTEPEDLLKLESWTDIDVRSRLKQDGFNLERLQKSLNEERYAASNQDFNDLFNATRTWYAIDRFRRDKQESELMKRLFENASPLQLKSIQEEVKSRFSPIKHRETESTGEIQKRVAAPER